MDGDHHGDAGPDWLPVLDRVVQGRPIRAQGHGDPERVEQRAQAAVDPPQPRWVYGKTGAGDHGASACLQQKADVSGTPSARNPPSSPRR